MHGYTHIHIGWKFFWKQVYGLFRNPVFIVLTVIGNGLMLVGACVFYDCRHCDLYWVHRTFCRCSYCPRAR